MIESLQEISKEEAKKESTRVRLDHLMLEGKIRFIILQSLFKERERTALVALVQNRSSFDDQINPWQFPGTSINMACYRLHKYLNCQCI